jgi:hypothetical protein
MNTALSRARAYAEILARLHYADGLQAGRKWALFEASYSDLRTVCSIEFPNEVHKYREKIANILFISLHGYDSVPEFDSRDAIHSEYTLGFIAGAEQVWEYVKAVVEAAEESKDLPERISLEGDGSWVDCTASVTMQSLITRLRKSKQEFARSEFAGGYPQGVDFGRTDKSFVAQAIICLDFESVRAGRPLYEFINSILAPVEKPFFDADLPISDEWIRGFLEGVKDGIAGGRSHEEHD